MTELKGCPFCGRKPELHVEKIANERLYWVTCKCGVEWKAYHTKEHTIRKWNRRVEYDQGWIDGREALEEEMWECSRG